MCGGGGVAAAKWVVVAGPVMIAAALVLGLFAILFGARRYEVAGRTEGMPALLDLVPGLRTPWLGLYGDADASIPVEDVEQLREVLAAGADVDTAIVRYPGAAHGFHCDVRESYDGGAATDAWARTLAWLDDHLAPVPRG